MRKACAAVVAASLCLAGCAAVTTVDGRRLGLGSAEFRAYAEAVFRRQNEVATQLAFALDDRTSANGKEPPGLSAAEDALLAACAPLNEIATARRDELHVGLGQRLETARTVPACERATNAAAAALARR